MRACEQASPPGVGQSRSGIVRHRHNLHSPNVLGKDNDREDRSIVLLDHLYLLFLE